MPVKKQVPLAPAATARAASSRPPADAKVAAAPAGPAKVTLDRRVAARINELNASGELGQDIRKPAVAKLLSQIDPSQAVEILDGVFADEGAINDPNTFVNDVCRIYIEQQAAQAAAAEEEEAWDEGAEEEAWDEGAEEQYQEEGADEEVAAPAPKRQKVAAAYLDKLSPAVAKHVTRLNKVFAEPIELKHCGESLAQLSADDAISVLGKLEKSADKVENPTVWLIQHLTSKGTAKGASGKEGKPGDWYYAPTPATKGKGKGKDKGKAKGGPAEETRKDRVQHMLAQRQREKKGKGGSKGGGPGGDDAGGDMQLNSKQQEVLKKITSVNRKAGWNIRYSKVRTFLDLLYHNTQLELIDKAFENRDTISQPARWLEVACAKKKRAFDAAAEKNGGAGAAARKGKGAHKGKPKAAGPQLAEDSKVLKRLRFIQNNVELAVPLEIPAVSAKLALLEEETAMELLKQLAKIAETVRNPNSWLLGTVRKLLQEQQAAGNQGEWDFEDQALEEGEA